MKRLAAALYLALASTDAQAGQELNCLFEDDADGFEIVVGLEGRSRLSRSGEVHAGLVEDYPIIQLATRPGEAFRFEVGDREEQLWVYEVVVSDSGDPDYMEATVNYLTVDGEDEVSFAGSCYMF